MNQQQLNSLSALYKAMNILMEAHFANAEGAMPQPTPAPEPEPPKPEQDSNPQ